jgi:colanic acid/amylovoran biosynthesis glycosyltransferase
MREIDPSSPPRVAIYRDRLLPSSETFVASQAAALRDFTPVFVGSKRVAGLDIDQYPFVLVNDGTVRGRIAEVAFKFCRRIPPHVDRAVRLAGPTLLHAHFGVDGAFALALADRHELPFVVTFHGYDATMSDAAVLQRSDWNHRLLVVRRGRLARRADLIIAVSDFIRRALLARGVCDDKIAVHYIGVDVDAFSPDPAVPREPVVLFVGRLVEKKGAEYVISAMERVQAQRPDVELVVIGDGPLRGPLERAASGSRIRVRFLGVQPAREVRRWMNRASVFCVPSVVADSGDAEGFGLVFAEAQAMGLPVVSCASGGIPEAVAHGRTGLLVKERDHRALAAAMLKLLSDPDCWRAFSCNGRQRVVEQFNLSIQTRRLEQLYDETIRRFTAGHHARAAA